MTLKRGGRRGKEFLVQNLTITKPERKLDLPPLSREVIDEASRLNSQPSPPHTASATRRNAFLRPYNPQNTNLTTRPRVEVHILEALV